MQQLTSAAPAAAAGFAARLLLPAGWRMSAPAAPAAEPSATVWTAVSVNASTNTSAHPSLPLTLQIWMGSSLPLTYGWAHQ